MQPESWRIFPPYKPERRVEEREASNEYVVDIAAKWADHRFSTYDGRRFACVHGGESILRRAQTLGIFLTARETGLLEKRTLVGAIVEFGSTEPPMLYGDFDTLRSDWLELHRSFDAPFTEEETIAFDVWPSSRRESTYYGEDEESPDALGA